MSDIRHRRVTLKGEIIMKWNELANKEQEVNKEKIYYKQQLKKLVNKINSAEDLEAIKVYIKEQDL